MCPRFCSLALKKGICKIHGFLGFFLLRGKKMCITNDLLRFASWYWRKENAQLSISLVLFPSIQERNLQISSLLRFSFLRLKEGIWVAHGLFAERNLQISLLLRFGFLWLKERIWETHGLLCFESLNWRKGYVYAGVSYANSFLQSKEAKGRKSLVMQISARKLRNQN